ncbi:MAG: YihY family inner membrane protein [Candidatus Binataceae bacterium]|nr:YihY family inner membrane protein [Candidatus Binataceae bacterium]
MENFLANNDLLRASALTYTVALSIVPILALAFSVLKGLGGYNELRPVMDRVLALGAPHTSQQLMTYVSRTNAAAIGSAGAVFLLITVVSTMGTIESAFNEIWRVSRSRSYLRKFTDYLSVLFTVPLLMVAALTLTTVFTARVTQVPLITAAMPYMIAWAAFFFLYVFFPYTHVNYKAALIGSIIAAVLFQVVQWAYVRFQIGVASYEAIYGALAAVPIFLVWIYIAWSIVLFGAEIAATIQRGTAYSQLSPGSPEFPYVAALHILLRLSDQHLRGARPLTTTGFASELGVDLTAIVPIIARLRNAGLIIEAGTEPKTSRHGFVLGRLPSTIRLSEAVGSMPTDRVAGLGDARIREIIQRLASVHHELLGALTLADLLDGKSLPSTPNAAEPGEAHPTNI